MANSMERPPMQKQAERLAEQGRFGDSMLVHMNPEEVEGIASLVPGGQLTINPETGQPEAFLGLAAIIGSAIAGGVRQRKANKAAQKQSDAIAAKSAPFDKFTADQLNKIASGDFAALSPGKSYEDYDDKGQIGFLPKGTSPGMNFDFQNTPGTMFANYKPTNPFAMEALPKQITQQPVTQDPIDTDETGGTVATIPADDLGGMAPDFDDLEMINASRRLEGLPELETMEDIVNYLADINEGGPGGGLPFMSANEGGLASLPQGFFAGGGAEGTSDEEQARENERLREELSRGIFGGIGMLRRGRRQERRADRRAMRQQRRGDRQAAGGWYLGKNLGRANPSMGGANQVNYSEATRPQQSPQAPQEGGWYLGKNLGRKDPKAGGWYPGKRFDDWKESRKSEGQWYPGENIEKLRSWDEGIDKRLDDWNKKRREKRKSEDKWYLGKNLEDSKIAQAIQGLNQKAEARDAANAYARSMGVPEAQRGGWGNRISAWDRNADTWFQDRFPALGGRGNEQSSNEGGLRGLLSLLGGYADGDMVEHFPRVNGQISGPGTERSDDIPAMLSDGEFVVNAKAVRGIGNIGGANGSKEDQRREGARMMYALQNAGEQAMRRT